MSETIKHLSAADFDEQIKSENPVLVDFWAAWCGPCKMLAPVLDDIASKTEGMSFGKVDVDEEEEIALKYGVMSIPTLIIFKDGIEVAKSIGFKNAQQLTSFINDNK